jgi:ABC-type multidrug transport system fused ATPase/permease subunit
MTRLFPYLFKEFGVLTPILCLIMLLSSVLEGASIASILPLLCSLGLGGSQESQLVLDMTYNALGVVGLPQRPFSVGIVVAGLFTLQFSLYLAQAWMSSSLLTTHQIRLRNRLYKSFLEADWPFLQRASSARLQSALVNDALRTTNALSTCLQVLSAGLGCLTYASLSLLLSWPLTTAMLIIGGLMVLTLRTFLQHGRRVGQDLSSVSQAMLGCISETFGGIKYIKASASEALMRARFEAINQRSWKPAFHSSFQPHLVKTIVDTMSFAILIASLLLSILLLHMDLPMVLIILTLFSRLSPRFSTLQQGLQSLSMNQPALELVDRIQAEAEQRREQPGKTPENAPKVSTPLEIRVEDLSASWGGSEILRRVSLRLAPGSMTALVGESGSGKTTLIDCILGLVPPTSGRVLVNGADLADIGSRSLRTIAGYAAQDPVIFNDSIRENILWDQAEASPERLTQAIRLADAEAFVENLPDALETAAGDAGCNLSGGQRQRIALARVLLRDLKLLILDETTSALDAHSEQRVMESIARLRGTHTIILVTHRLQNVRQADTIHMLEDGQIIDSGPWGELVARCGKFRELWEKQVKSDADVHTAPGNGADGRKSSCA